MATDAPLPSAGLDDAGAAADRALVLSRVGGSGTSFYTAMRLLPVARREAMFAVYAFCREVDDIADEPAPAADKQAGLAAWRDRIAALYEGREPGHALARALAGPIARYRLRREDFLAVVDGMAMDAERDIRGPSLADLELYSARVAGAVGMLSVRIFGADGPAADAVATSLGGALQLTNILRDLDEDAARGRLYLPRELLDRHGIAGDDPAAILAHPALPLVCGDLAAMAETRFRQAGAAMRSCPRGTMRAPRMMAGAYRAILVRLLRRGWAPPRLPVTVPTAFKLWIALRGLLG